MAVGCSNEAPGEGDVDSTGGSRPTGGSASNDGTGGLISGGAAGSASGGSASADGSGGGSSELDLPPGNASFDYQIGGAYAPRQGVAVVSRDREDEPAAGLYNICYVNGFQTQPQDEDWWLNEHPELVLRDDEGEPVIDEDWGEMILDTSTASKRTALLSIVETWIAGCQMSGFDAVEIDNLDTYSRSDDRLTPDNNVTFMAMLSDAAHELGLAVGQKNSTELLSRVSDMKTDFAVAEECNRWDECGDYQAAYGDLVFIIEYRDQDFDQGCKDFPELSIVRRDLDVSPAGSADYVYEGC